MKTNARITLEFFLPDVQTDSDTILRLNKFAESMMVAVGNIVLVAATKTFKMNLTHNVRFEQDVPPTPGPKGEAS